MKRESFPPELRLRSQHEFQRVYELRCRVSDDRLLLYGAPNGQSYSRIGLSVSRRLGNAVRRARLKRMLREAFRRTRHELPVGWDWILIPRKQPALTVAQLQRSLGTLSNRLINVRTRQVRKSGGEDSPVDHEQLT